MRPRVGSVVILVIAVGTGICACGTLGGLGDYAEGTAADKITIDGSDASGDDRGAVGDDADPNSDSSASDDGTVATDDADGGGTGSGDAGEHLDASAFLDARPACSLTTCNGCCDPQGNCTSGLSQSTCGLGGGTCNSCGSGYVCSRGSCVEDAGAPSPVMCVASACGKCGVAQSTCCKTTTTCGCAYPFAPCL